MKKDSAKMPSMDQLEMKKMHYPSIVKLDEDDLPEIKDWMTGKKYKVELVMEQIQSSKGDEFMPMGDTDSDKVHSKFKVVKVLGGEEYDKKEMKEEKKEKKEDKSKVVLAVKHKFGYKD